MKRPLLIACALLLALALPAGAAAKVGNDFFGATAVDPTDHDFDGMAATGFGDYRFELSWRVIQKTRKSGYDWGYVDARVAQAARAGIRPSLVIYGTPRFVRKSPNGLFPPTDSKRNLEAWRDFVAAAVERYGRDGDFWAANPGLPEMAVHRWLVWNEQNARAFWRPRPDPRDYAKLVKATDQAASAVDRKAEIVLGGMFGYPQDERSRSATSFLRDLYRVKGIERHFDAINITPTAAASAPSASRSPRRARSSARPATRASPRWSVRSAGRRAGRRAATWWSAPRARRSACRRA